MLWFLLSGLACMAPQLIAQKALQSPVHRVEAKGLEFAYSFGDTVQMGERLFIDFRYSLRNDSGDTLHYLNQTCNQLDFYLLFRPRTHKVNPYLNCNSSYRGISSLAPGDSITFETRFSCPKGVNPIDRIGIDLRAVDRYISLEDLKANPQWLESLHLAPTDYQKVIWHWRD